MSIFRKTNHENSLICLRKKGTNVENIIRYFNGNKSVNISVIYSNNKNSGAILHAKKIPNSRNFIE